MTKQKQDKKDLLKLDVRILTPRFVKDDYGVYIAELLNGEELNSDNSSFFQRYEEITITGNFDRRYFFDEEYIMYAVKTEHAKFGVQYAIQVVQDKFDTPTRVKAFLKQFCVDSIVDQLLNLYGGEVIQKIIDNEVDYSLVHGMGEYRFNQLREKVLQNEYMKDIIIELGGIGITPLQMKKIIDKFGANAVEKIKDNPYSLCQINGIGFLKADDIAKNMGYDMESTNRIDEVVKYAIGEMQQSGNAWVQMKNLIQRCNELTTINRDIISSRLPDVPDVYIDDTRVTLQKTYDAEMYIAERLTEMIQNPISITYGINEFIIEQEQLQGATLTDEQKSFFDNFLKYNVNFLIGYAGCGKSFLQKMIINLATKLNADVLLLAPTGKASKVLSAYTGREAMTIHRALGGALDDDESQGHIWQEWIIVDEASMADVYLVAKLLKALKNPNVRILFVGDDFQIPSVGVGNFLHDCVMSQALPVSKLTQVFRQKEGGVLDIATKIRLGERFLSDDDKGKVSFGKDMIVHIASSEQFESLYLKYHNAMNMHHVESLEDIVVLSSTKKGAVGTYAINNTLQQIVNPHVEGQPEIQSGQITTFREKDMVINLKNYQTPATVNGIKVDKILIVNGDTGVIAKIDKEKRVVQIDYGFALVDVKFEALDLITHVYAMTMHKSQGSGYPVVIIVADKAHKWQLNANLLYTAITRTKDKCILLTQPDVINSAIKKVENQNRNTFLKEMLQKLKIKVDKVQQ